MFLTRIFIIAFASTAFLTSALFAATFSQDLPKYLTAGAARLSSEKEPAEEPNMIPTHINSAPQNEQDSFLLSLPDEILLKIMQNLTDLEDGAHLSLTCKKLYVLAQDDSLNNLRAFLWVKAKDPKIQITRLFKTNPGYQDQTIIGQRMLFFSSEKEPITQQGILDFGLYHSLSSDPVHAFLDLEYLQKDTVRSLFKVLRTNKAISQVRLVDANLSDDLTDQITDVLTHNTYIKDFTLEGDKKNSAAKIMAEILRVNTSLATLGLKMNLIGKEGATALARALEINKTLITLDLSSNLPESALKDLFLSVLETHPSLKKVSLTGCYLDAPLILEKQFGEGGITITGEAPPPQDLSRSCPFIEECTCMEEFR